MVVDVTARAGLTAIVFSCVDSRSYAFGVLLYSRYRERYIEHRFPFAQEQSVLEPDRGGCRVLRTRQV
jgi:hypothetical protein